MKKTNYHMHTERCNHAWGDDEDFIKKAIQEGFCEVGFSDHACWDYKTNFVPRIRMMIDKFPDYKESVLTLREKYKDQIHILLGMEAEYYEGYMDWMLDFCIEEEIDYLILGNHFLDTDEKGIYFGGCPSKYAMKYFDSLEKGIRSGMFAYVAHPELVMRNSYLEWDDKMEQAFTKICQAAKEMDMPLELNCLGLQCNLRNGVEAYPHSKFWELASRMGCKAIIGMDAHTMQDLDSKWYNLALEYLKNYDLEIVDSIQKIDYQKLKKSQNIR